MAQSLMLSSKAMMMVRVIFALGGAMFSSCLIAQTLLDPTRPSMLASESSINADNFNGPVLQSILIAPNRRVAIISGQAVTLNGKYGEQTLIKMSETEVVLRNGKELQTLKLFPDFDKKLVRASGK
jgi:MSHA biogenesis protein MshK